MLKNYRLLTSCVMSFLFLIVIGGVNATLDDAKGYWSFDQNAATLTDATGNGNSADVIGAVFVSSAKIAGGYQTSSTKNITINASPIINNYGDFTYSMWVNSTGEVTGWYWTKGRYYYDKGGFLGGISGKYFFGISTGDCASSGASCENAPSATAIGSGVKHLVLVRRGSVVELWVNGANPENKTGCSTATLSACTMAKTYVSNGGGAGLNGYTTVWDDEFGFWNRSLSVAEIGSLYNSGTGVNPYATISPCTCPTSGDYSIGGCTITTACVMASGTTLRVNGTAYVNAEISNYDKLVCDGKLTLGLSGKVHSK